MRLILNINGSPMRPAAFALAGAALLAACSETGPADVGTDPATLTVDATAGWAFVALGESAAQVTVTDATTSTGWDIAFNATRVMLNGGAAGPGGVVGYCVCQNAAATEGQIEAMTPAAERGGFEAVMLAAVPAGGDAWESDALDAAITGWYAYNVTTHEVSAVPSEVWKVRGAGPAPEYAKLHITDIAGATQSAARVTIEYAVQPSAGEPLGATQSAVLDGHTGPVRFDFATSAVVETDSWDIMLDGYDIRINGGVSGTGGAGAVAADESFAAMTDASDAPAQIYRGDAFGGVFAMHPWYRYNLDGNHTIFPTFDVFLVKRGTAVYKIQIIGYYNTAGDARHITFRYARLDS
jgi:hypothetical protein